RACVVLDLRRVRASRRQNLALACRRAALCDARVLRARRTRGSDDGLACGGNLDVALGLDPGVAHFGWLSGDGIARAHRLARGGRRLLPLAFAPPSKPAFEEEVVAFPMPAEPVVEPTDALAVFIEEEKIGLRKHRSLLEEADRAID